MVQDSVFAADMDGDGDMDIVSASYNDDTIAWYKNDGAADPSWAATDISTSSGGANSVHAADMDGDGDMDIISVLLLVIPFLGMRMMELQTLLGPKTISY